MQLSEKQTHVISGQVEEIYKKSCSLHSGLGFSDHGEAVIMVHVFTAPEPEGRRPSGRFVI